MTVLNNGYTFFKDQTLSLCTATSDPFKIGQAHTKALLFTAEHSNHELNIIYCFSLVGSPVEKPLSQYDTPFDVCHEKTFLTMYERPSSKGS